MMGMMKKEIKRRIVNALIFSAMPSIIGMLLAYLWDGARSGIHLHPFLQSLAEPFNSGGLFYAMGGGATRMVVTITVGILYLPIDVLVFICFCIWWAILAMIKYWRKNKVVFLVHGLSNFDVIGKYVSACGDEIPLSLVFEEAGRLYWKKLFFQLSGAKLMFTVFLGHEDRVIHFCADHFELPDNSRSDVAVLLTRVNDGCQLRIFVAPAGSLSKYKNHDALCKALDERFTICSKAVVGHARDSEVGGNVEIKDRCYLIDCRKSPSGDLWKS